VRPMDRPGKAIEVRDSVVAAVECQWLIGKESLEDVNGLFKTTYAGPRAVEGYTGLIVLRAEPSDLRMVP
jgi:hypothetical protein